MQIGGKTLKEIAEMPLWEMTLFIREHHDKNWGVMPHKLGDPLKKYEVFINYNHKVTEVAAYEVEACDEKEAEAIATDEFNSECDYDDEFVHASVSEIDKD